MSNLGMNQPIAEYPYNGTLYSHKNEQIINICNNMGASQDNYSEWKMEGTSDTILYLYNIL